MRLKKPWQHREILIGLYHEQHLTIRTIAQILNTTASNVLYWMRKLDVNTREFSIGDLNKGRKLTDKEREHLSKIAKERFKDPSNHPMYGKKHSEESKQKMSETKKRRRAERLGQTLMSE